MFKMTLNQKDGILLVSYSGYFTVYDAELFQRELSAKVRSIRPEDYVLVIDVHDVRLSKAELGPMMEEIRRIVTDAPFRTIFAVEADGTLAAKAKRLAMLPGNWSTVTSVDEALTRLRKSKLHSRGAGPG